MFKKLFAILGTLARQPKSILRVLNPSTGESRLEVQHNHGLANGLPVVDIEELAGTIKGDEVYPHAFMDGGSMPTDLLLLRKLAQRPQTETYLEIGTWRGESVMNVAPFVSKAITFNLPDEEIKRRGGLDAYITQGAMFIQDTPNVQQVKADSLIFDFAPFHNQVDLAFIDGDHHYPAVKQDTINAFKLLRNDDAIIVWHDYGFTPEAVRWEVLLAILDGTPPELRKYLYHVSHTKKCGIYPETFENQAACTSRKA